MEKVNKYLVTVVYPTRDVSFRVHAYQNFFDFLQSFEAGHTRSFNVYREDKNEEYITILPGYLYATIIEILEEELEKDATPK